MIGPIDSQIVSSTSPTLDCGDEPGFVCSQIAERTGSGLAGRISEMLVDRPVRVLLVIALAFVVSRILSRLVSRVGGSVANRGANQVVSARRRPSAGDRFGTDVDKAHPKQGTDATGRIQLRAKTVVSVVSSLSTVVVWFVAGVVILDLFSISLAPLLAGAGVLGVALGFGAQSIVADFLSGLFMLFEDQFGVGDVIDVGEATGRVEDFSLRTTTLRDVNGTVWHIRNSEIRRVANKSQLWSRAVLDIEVAYDTDLRRAEGIIQRVADGLWADHSFTDGDIIDPPEVWGIEKLGADGVVIRLVVKTDPAEQWVVARELRLRIKEALDEAGIEIPFPQRTVWVRQDEAVPRNKRPVVEVAPIRPVDLTGDVFDNPS